MEFTGEPILIPAVEMGALKRAVEKTSKTLIVGSFPIPLSLRYEDIKSFHGTILPSGNYRLESVVKDEEKETIIIKYNPKKRTIWGEIIKRVNKVLPTRMDDMRTAFPKLAIIGEHEFHFTEDSRKFLSLVKKHVKSNKEKEIFSKMDDGKLYAMDGGGILGFDIFMYTQGDADLSEGNAMMESWKFVFFGNKTMRIKTVLAPIGQIPSKNSIDFQETGKNLLKSIAGEKIRVKK